MGEASDEVTADTAALAEWESEAEEAITQAGALLDRFKLQEELADEFVLEKCTSGFDATIACIKITGYICLVLVLGGSVFFMMDAADEAKPWQKSTADVMIVALGLSSTLLTQSANSKSLRNADLWSRFTRCHYTKAFYAAHSRTPRTSKNRRSDTPERVGLALMRCIKVVPVFCIWDVATNGAHETNSDLQRLLSEISLLTKLLVSTKNAFQPVVCETAILSMCGAANELVAEARHPAYPAGIFVFVRVIFVVTAVVLPAKFASDDGTGCIPTLSFIFIIFAPLIITFYSQVPFCEGKNGLPGGQSKSAKEDLKLALKQNRAIEGKHVTDETPYNGSSTCCGWITDACEWCSTDPESKLKPSLASAPVFYKSVPQAYGRGRVSPQLRVVDNTWEL